MEFEVVHDVPIEKWAKYVLSHPKGNIFHTPEMFEVFRRTKGYEPYSIFVIEKNTGDIGSLLSSVRVTVRDGVLSKLTGRSIFYGGVLADESKIGEEAISVGLKVHDSQIRKSVIFAEMRNRDDCGNHRSILEANGYIYGDDLTYVIDLGKGEDKIFQSFATDRRKNIRKAEKKGAVVSEVGETGEVSKFYEILRSVYSRKRVPLADISLFESSFNLLFKKGMFKIFIAQFENKCIGAHAVLLFNGRILAWYGGAHEEWSALHPNELIVWHIIKWGIANGYRTFDLGGAGKPGEKYGVRDFKARFGGTLSIMVGILMSILLPCLGWQTKVMRFIGDSPEVE